MYTVSELAKKYGKPKPTVHGWVQRGKFPNAVQKTDPYGQTYWEIPESDLEGFTPQDKRGKPRDSNPSAGAQAVRRFRGIE